MVKYIIDLLIKLLLPKPVEEGEVNAFTQISSIAVDSITKIESRYGDFCVILDPGHGKSEPGKRSPDESIREYITVRRLCSLIIDELKPLGIQYSVTVPDYNSETNTFDLNYPLDTTFLPSRAKHAIKIPSKNKLFISLHLDGFGDTWNSARGMTVFRYPGTNPTVSKIVMSILKDATELFPRREPLKEDNFSVLRNTRKYMHSILFEHGFMTNRKDVEILKKEETLPLLAKAWAKAIRKIATKYEQLGKY